jgi:hypothetical protein
MARPMPTNCLLPAFVLAVLLLAPVASGQSSSAHSPAPKSQSDDEAEAASAGCLSCHTTTDEATMHRNPAVQLGCTDCHGGDAAVQRVAESDPGAPAYRDALRRAHVSPRYPEAWAERGSGNPVRPYTLYNRESPEFIRFVNPGDLRVAREACGACHLSHVTRVERSLMATSAMFWGGASYNNGVLPSKRYSIGEAYTRDGETAAIRAPSDFLLTPELKRAGVLASLDPMPRWETTPPGQIFRVFERGGRNLRSLFPEIGLPNRLEEPGRPDIRQSDRGKGTGTRVSIPVLNLHKTRLNDPNLWFAGTNDQPGDFRQSGCSACHVVYANDRDPVSSGAYASAGNRGRTQTTDPTIAPLRDSDGNPAPGHPIRHEFTRAIPTSQCMTCHLHQANAFLNSFLGFTMWDYESDAPLMWPTAEEAPSAAVLLERLDRNPAAADARGKWADVEFLTEVWRDVNPKARDTQFADYHSHGWNFRAVHKRDRDGTLLDAKGAPVSDALPPSEKWKRAVHLKDIHAEKGMQCADCHFSGDSHGNGLLHAEVAAEVEIRCIDCHGTVDAYAKLRTSGPAAQDGRSLARATNMDGRRRFVWRDGRLYQRLVLPPHTELAVSQVRDSVTPGHSEYSEKSARAKTVARGNPGRSGLGVPVADRAHRESEMACFSCHSSWMTSCAGCHLPIEANWKSESKHYEGGPSRGLATYNPQVARDQMFQLGRHGDVKNGIIAPVRSSSALLLSSTDINRNRIYAQQQPVSSGGYSAQAFAPHFPHTVRKTETRQCDDCHVSKSNDNNAIIAQLLLLGTNFVNFVGFNAWVGTEADVQAVQVTEWDEPQAVIGSYLHRYAFPDRFRDHQERDLSLRGVGFGVFDADPSWVAWLRDALSGPLFSWLGSDGQMNDGTYGHAAGRVDCLQLRGEYLYAAQGSAGFQAYDVASVANKAFSERIVTAPFSPLGHDAHVATRNATCVALPTNQLVRPERNRESVAKGENREQPMHPVYSYAAITDSEEGLILVDVETLADFEPRNNFLRRALTWNPDGVLDGAVYAHFAGHILYVSADDRVVVVDLDDPLKPRLLAKFYIEAPQGLAVQFRYLFVAAAEGLKVVDITSPAKPKIIEEATIELDYARRVFVARTYAYVASGREGLVIVDVENPEAPRVQQVYTADGKLDDAQDVVVASTNASLFAYVADGRNGLKVVQLTSPELQPRFYGFSPAPNPRLIAWRDTDSPMRALSRPLERDRAVDETGHQISVFGRLGSRPFNREEMERLYLDDAGELWTVD